VTDTAGLASFGGAVASFDGVVAAMALKPKWAAWSPGKACTLDRGSDAASVGLTIEYACKEAWFDCAHIPAQCKNSTWDIAEYVLSVYSMERDGDPLPTCSYKGSLIFSRAVASLSPCVVTKDPATTPLTDEGFQAVLKLKDAASLAVFMRRVIEEQLHGVVIDLVELDAFAASPPASMYEMVSLLSGAAWVCISGSAACSPDSANVPLTASGFRIIHAQQNATRMSGFIVRVVKHFGGRLVDVGLLRLFAKNVSSFEDVVSAVDAHPQWAAWYPGSACTLDPKSDAALVGLTIEYACGESWFNCANIPEQCSNSSWDTAEYVLSVYAMERDGSPLPTCSVKGALIFARVVASMTRVSPCIVTGDPLTTPLTDEGFQAVLRQKDALKVAIFMQRLVEERLGGVITNELQLMAFAADPAPSMYDVVSLLRNATWVCVGDASVCSVDASLIPLSDSGYQRIRAQGNISSLASFVTRVVAHFGGQVVDVSGLRSAGQSFTTLAGLVAKLESKPTWATWDAASACESEPRSGLAGSTAVSLSIEYACLHMNEFSCENIPPQCSSSLWDAADYALSVYALEHKGDSLPSCYFKGG